MAIEYKDGSFSETLSFDEAIKRVHQEMAKNIELKALHFGTPEEIEEQKDTSFCVEKIKELEKKIKELAPVKTTLEIPTNQEISYFAREQTIFK